MLSRQGKTPLIFIYFCLFKARSSGFRLSGACVGINTSQLTERNCLEGSKCPCTKKLCALCVALGMEQDQLAVQSLPPDPFLKKQRSLSYGPTSWLCGVGLLWPHPSCPLPPHLHPPRLPQPPDQSWRLGPVLGSASTRPRRGSRSGGPLLFVLMETTRDLGFGLVRQGLERSRGSSGAVACRFNLRSNSISLEQCWLCVS